MYTRFLYYILLIELTTFGCNFNVNSRTVLLLGREGGLRRNHSQMRKYNGKRTATREIAAISFMGDRL